MLPRAADSEQNLWSYPAPSRSQPLRLVGKATAADASDDEWEELIRRAKAATEADEEREWAALLHRVQATQDGEQDEWLVQLSRVKAAQQKSEEDEWEEFIRRARSTPPDDVRGGLVARSYIAALRPEPKGSSHACSVTPARPASQPLRFTLPDEKPRAAAPTPIADEASRVVVKAHVLPVNGKPVAKNASYLESRRDKLGAAREAQVKLESGIKPIAAESARGAISPASAPEAALHSAHAKPAKRETGASAAPTTAPAQSAPHSLPPPAAATRTVVSAVRTSSVPPKSTSAPARATSSVASDKPRTSSPGMAALRMKAVKRAAADASRELPTLAVRKVEEAVIAQRNTSAPRAALPAAPARAPEEVAPTKKDSSLMLLSRTLEAVKPSPRRPSRGAPPPPPPCAFRRGPTAAPARPVSVGPTKVLPSGLPALRLPPPPPKSRVPTPGRPKLNIPPPPPPSRAAASKGVAERLGAAFAWLTHRGGSRG